MDFLKMFEDSEHLQALRKSIVETPDLELQSILLEVQGTVNAFIHTIGQCLVSDLVADTYLLYGEPFSTEQIKVFSIAVIMFNRATGVQDSIIIPFRLLMTACNGVEAGLYLCRN